VKTQKTGAAEDAEINEENDTCDVDIGITDLKWDCTLAVVTRRMRLWVELPGDHVDRHTDLDFLVDGGRAIMGSLTAFFCCKTSFTMPTFMRVVASTYATAQRAGDQWRPWRA